MSLQTVKPDKPARPTLSRRQFLGLATLIGGAGALGTQALNAVTQTLGHAANQARKFLPAFSADANSFGKLVGENGQPLPVPNAAPTPAPAGKHRWVMVIDLARCDGCHLCTEACNAMHNVPAGQEWIRVSKMQDPRTNATYWFPRPCFQCDNSPCTKVCPVSATYKREDGVVLIDQDRCIGCRYCMAACPYSSRFFTWAEPQQTAEERAQPYDVEMNTPHRRGVAEKCLFCPSLLRKGQLPACAANCPMGAIYAGDELEDIVTNGRGESAKFSKLIQDSSGYRYLEELGTKPRVWYLPPRGRQFAPPQPDKEHAGHG
jgi:molybdopterin-containing oxidoreductase family iron-sulfur binding subunit